LEYSPLKRKVIVNDDPEGTTGIGGYFRWVGEVRMENNTYMVIPLVPNAELRNSQRDNVLEFFNGIIPYKPFICNPHECIRVDEIWGEVKTEGVMVCTYWDRETASGRYERRDLSGEDFTDWVQMIYITRRWESYYIGGEILEQIEKTIAAMNYWRYMDKPEEHHKMTIAIMKTPWPTEPTGRYYDGVHLQSGALYGNGGIDCSGRFYAGFIAIRPDSFGMKVMFHELQNGCRGALDVGDSMQNTINTAQGQIEPTSDETKSWGIIFAIHFLGGRTPSKSYYKERLFMTDWGWFPVPSSHLSV